MLIFKTLHILAMFAMVTIEIGLETLFAAAIIRRDVPARRLIYRLENDFAPGPSRSFARRGRRLRFAHGRDGQV